MAIQDRRLQIRLLGLEYVSDLATSDQEVFGCEPQESVGSRSLLVVLRERACYPCLCRIID